MASRRKARELALQMLFQCDLGGETPTHVVSTFLEFQKVDPETAAFARSLLEGCWLKKPEIDRLVREHAEHWRLERMAAVDRNILRLALYEMLYLSENPPAVVINEALELARRFSTGESVEFVNGVLDAVRRNVFPASSSPHKV